MLKDQLFYRTLHEYTPRPVRGQASPKLAKSPHHFAKIQDQELAAGLNIARISLVA
jgi:hypothetical protein